MKNDDKEQGKRDDIAAILKACGYTNALNTFTGYAFKNGRVVNLNNDPVTQDLIPALAMLQVEINFQRRFQYVSRNGAPPVKRPATRPQDAGPRSDLPPELTLLIKELEKRKEEPANDPTAQRRSQIIEEK